MTRNYTLLPITMGLFDGGGAGAGAGAAAGGAAPAAGEGAAQQGDTKGAVRGAASRGKSGESSQQTVLYGKQAGDMVQQQDAGAAESESEETLRAEFRELANGKYKNAYTAEMQSVIDKRFRASKETERKLASQQPVIDLLMQRHGITDGDMGKLLKAVEDADPTLENRAEENGLTVEQQRKMDANEREVARLRREVEQYVKAQRADEDARRWLAETEIAKAEYPNLDIRAEIQNPKFMNLLRAGHDVRTAYEVIHRDEIFSQLRAMTAANTERRVVDNIRAQGMRPRENGTSSQGSFITKSDPRTLTRQDHKAIRERVRNGEKIVF